MMAYFCIACIFRDFITLHFPGSSGESLRPVRTNKFSWVWLFHPQRDAQGKSCTEETLRTTKKTCNK